MEYLVSLTDYVMRSRLPAKKSRVKNWVLFASFFTPYSTYIVPQSKLRMYFRNVDAGNAGDSWTSRLTRNEQGIGSNSAGQSLGRAAWIQAERHNISDQQYSLATFVQLRVSLVADIMLKRQEKGSFLTLELHCLTKYGINTLLFPNPWLQYNSNALSPL